MPFERSTKKVYKNTLFLYFRMILLLGVNLYTSRVILEALGVVDFGIYNVVAGIIVVLSFISNSMSLAVNRYISFEMGRDNGGEVGRIFSVSVNIHALIALLVIVFGETAGLWFVNHKLVIPPERIVAANWIYQFSIFSFVMTVFRVPYNAMIIAYEEMKAYAYISIVEGLLRLLVAFSILYITFDKLIVYGGLMALSVALITVVYIFFCLRKYAECRYRFIWDGSLVKSMGQYAGISTMGNLSSVVLDQGQNILLNMFFGPVLNAARGIAYQVNTALNVFVSNLYMAATPQITKSYAADDREYLVKIVNQTALFSQLCLTVLVVPVMVELPYLLHLWLGDGFPEATVIFGRLVLLNMFTANLVKTLLIALQSASKIFKVHFYTGMLTIANIPIDYVLLKWFHIEAYQVFIVQFVIDLVFVYVVLYLADKQLNWNIREYMIKVIMPVSLLFVSDVGLLYMIMETLPVNFWTACLSFFISGSYVVLLAYLFVLPKELKTALKKKIIGFISYKH